ncbi:MAG: hypothetical protein ABH876_00650 [Patescibacteria group bacterium]|nr:hypothetical protein [Patescibacteria group bacterium]MBU1876730.1 hypothetical protein [Patescibacteria group bacterium]
MTIIFNLCCFGGVIISFWVGIRMRKNYQESKIEQLRTTSNSLFFTSSAFIFFCLPNLILFDPVRVQIAFILVDISYLGAVLFFIPITLSFLKNPPLSEKFLLRFLFFWILIYAFLSILFFSPAIPLEIDGVVYYWKSGMPLLQGITRALLCSAAFFMAIFFIFQRKKIEGKILSTRSLLIGFGALMVMTAAIILFFFPYFYFSPKMVVLSGLIGLFGSSLGIIGVKFFQPFKEKLVKKIT